MNKTIFGVILGFALFVPSFAIAAEPVIVFAAASMKDVLDEAAEKFTAKEAIEIVTSLAGSSVLAKQIEAGAPAQIFISADLDWMDYLAERNLIRENSRVVIAGNALIIIDQSDAEKGDAISLLSKGRFAMGDPSNVPAGKYGKAALEKLKLWPDVEANAVLTENVRVALQYVSRGEVNNAIVYASDRTVNPDLIEVYRFPKNSHQPILYPAALVTSYMNTEAKKFLEFLVSDEGQSIITSKGFIKASEALK